jgi:hypothetical protein
MAGPGAVGELLLDPSVAPLRIARGQPWTGPGVPARVSVRLPSDAGLLGVPLYLQGRLLDPTPGAPVRIGLADGVRLRLGP